MSAFRDRISRNSKQGAGVGFQQHQVSIDDEIAMAPPPPPPPPVAPSDLFRFLNDPLLKRSPAGRRILNADGHNNSSDDFEAAFGEELDEGGDLAGSANVSFTEGGQNGKSRTFKREASSLLRDAVLLQATVVEYHGELLYPDGSTSNERLLQQHKDQQEAAAALVAAGQAAAQAAANAAALQQNGNRNSRSMYRSSADPANASINTSGGAARALASEIGSPLANTASGSAQPHAHTTGAPDGALPVHTVDPPKPSVYHHVQRSHIMNREALFHGKGTLVSTLGYSYTGEFDRGLMTGKGKMEWNDGTSYEGDFRHSMIVGVGKYIWANGDTYEGCVRDAVRHGHGTFTLKVSGERYEGEWVRGMRHGKGVLRYAPLSEDIYASRCQYDGEWRNDQKCGLGTMTYASGDVYEGEWRGDRRNGWGSMVWKRRGQPVEVYTGEWTDGTQEGYGESTYIRPSANFVLPIARPGAPGGIPSNLLLSSATTAQAMRDSAMNVYKGEFLGGERNGFGVMQYDDGSRFEGFWKDNHKHGEGKLLTSSGVVFVGNFLNGNPIGANGENADLGEAAGTAAGGGGDGEGNLSPRSVKKSLSEVATDIPFNASHAITTSTAPSLGVGGSNNGLNSSLSAAATTHATMSTGLRTVASPLPLHIHDILGVGVADPGEAVAEVQNVISRHSGVLKRVFYHYSNLESNVEFVTTPGGGFETKSSNADTGAPSSPLSSSLPLWRRSRTPGTMHIIQFIRMLNDCHLLNRHVTLAVVGRILCSFRDLHQSTTSEAFGNIGLPSPSSNHQGGGGGMGASSQLPTSPAITDPSSNNAFSATPTVVTDPDSFTPRTSVGTNMGVTSGSGVRAIRASKAASSSLKAPSTDTAHPAPPKSAMKKSMAPSSTTTTPAKINAPSRRTTGGTSGDAIPDSPTSGPLPDSSTTKAKKPFAGGSILLEPSAPKGPTACPSTMRRASLQLSSLQEGGSVANSIEEFMTKKSGVNVSAIKRKAMNSTGLPPSRTSPQLVSVAPPLVGQYQVPWREYRANLHSLRNGELTYRDFVETLVRVAALLYSGSSGCTPGSFEIYGSVGRRFTVLVEEHVIPRACVPGTASPLCSLTRDFKDKLRTLSGSRSGLSKHPAAMSMAEFGTPTHKRVNIRSDVFESSVEDVSFSGGAGGGTTEVPFLEALTEMFLQFSNGTFLGTSENGLHSNTLVVAHPHRKANQQLQAAAVNALRSGAGIGPSADGRSSSTGNRRSEGASPFSAGTHGSQSESTTPQGHSGLEFPPANGNTTVSAGFTIHATAGATMTVRQLMILVKTLSTFAQSHGAETLFPSSLTVTSLLRKLECGTGPLAKYDRFPQLTTEIARKQHYAAAQVKRLEMPAAANVQAVNELAQSISARSGRRGGDTFSAGVPDNSVSGISGMFPTNVSPNRLHLSTATSAPPLMTSTSTSFVASSNSCPVPTLAQVETEESAQMKAEALYQARKSMAKQSKGTTGMNEISTVVMDKELTFVEFVEAIISLARVVVGARQRAAISVGGANVEAKLVTTDLQIEYFARKVLFPFYFSEVVSTGSQS